MRQVERRWQRKRWRGKQQRAAVECFVEDLLLQVLKFLPLRQICRLRVVCKAWKSLLGSQRFLQAWLASCGHANVGTESWLVLVRKPLKNPPFARELIAFDTATRAWIPLQPFLQSLSPSALSLLGGPSLSCVANPLKDCMTPCLSQFAVTSAAGLVCFLVHPFCTSISSWTAHTRERDLLHSSLVYEDEDYSVLVLNLLTGSHHLLPPRPKHSYKFESALEVYLQVSIEPITGTPNYLVFLHPPMDCHEWNEFLEVYDSRSRSWKVAKFSNIPASTADLRDADYIWLGHWPEPHTIVRAYNANTNEWRGVLAPHIDTGFFPTMISWPKSIRIGLRHNGQLFAAAVEFGDGCLEGFSVWQLHLGASDLSSTIWAEVARTPSYCWKGFYDVEPDRCYKRHLEIKLQTSGSLVWMTAVHYLDSNYGGTYYPHLVYDLVRDSWYHLPTYEGGDDFMGAFTLQPSLVATA